ncbi:MAG TPA: hypothetical protein VHX61_01260 [Rhizomicrobium sp.]|nr:hypothetical protein [Rhizomicrobium sp.]
MAHSLTKISANSMGIVEVDETFVGGKARNRHKDKRGTVAAEQAAW